VLRLRQIGPRRRQRAHSTSGARRRRYEGDHRHRQPWCNGEGRRAYRAAFGIRTCWRSACPKTTPPSARRGPPPSPRP
jgi:hypothetical protein